jgi:hypothetical protein
VTAALARFRISRYAKRGHDKPQASPWKAAKPERRLTTGRGSARPPGAAEGRRQGAPRHRYLDGHDAGRDEARNAYLEGELRRVEQHNLNLIRDIVLLKQQMAERPKRRGR